MDERLVPSGGLGGRKSPHARRVLFLHDALGNGGAERQLALTVTNLPPGWRALVWTFRGGPFVDTIRDHGVPVVVASRFEQVQVRCVPGLVRTLLEWRPDIVHAWGAWSTLAAGPICRLMRIPLIYTGVRSAVKPGSPRVFLLDTMLAHVVTGNNRAGFIEKGVPANKSVLIRNGFDATRLSLGSASRTPGRDPLEAVMSARMVPGKDFQTLLSAARVFAGSNPGRMQFVLLGDGPSRPDLMTEFADLVDEGVAIFESPGTEVMPRVLGADIGVLLNDPSLLREGCSNSILEYMAAGLPVVCTAVGGNPELVEQDVTGFLVPPGDVMRVVQALEVLARSEARRTRMGHAGRLRVEQRYSMDAMIGSTVALYESLLTGRGR
ncbi:MAG: glycosyltransferase [Armatimonadetes bacterium]|nr:glycosyltransferase [Armatimonadota bacterium]